MKKNSKISPLKHPPCLSGFNTQPQYDSCAILYLYFFLPGCYYLYQTDNKVHKSSSICIYYQCGMQDTLPNMLLELLVQILAEPCFNILRTKEQLGIYSLSLCNVQCNKRNLYRQFTCICARMRKPDWGQDTLSTYFWQDTLCLAVCGELAVSRDCEWLFSPTDHHSMLMIEWKHSFIIWK